MNVEINMDIRYWNKETNYLFDFSSSDYEVQNIKIRESGAILRNNNEIFFMANKDSKVILSKFWSHIWNVNFYKDEVNLSLIDIGSSNSPSDKTFVTLKHTFNSSKLHHSNSNSYKLKQNDVIKLGKMTFLIKEVKVVKEDFINCSKAKEKTFADNIPDEDNKEEVLDNSFAGEVTRRKQKKSGPCRICLSDDVEIDNPLISPCKCCGSMKYIHLNCLRNWLLNKVQNKNYEHMSNFTYKSLDCELCLQTFPLKIKTKTSSVELLSMNIPSNSSYMILEQQVKDETEKSIFYVLFKDKSCLKLGRSNDSHVRLNDISISRHHANLILTHEGIFLEDNNSKFGTLLMLQSLLILIIQKQIGLQIGKHFILIEMERTLFSMLCCQKYNFF